MDTLTGAFNRQNFSEIIEREIERVKRYNQRLSLILYDIDHFKEVNDRHGHVAGDYVLKTISAIVKENIRKIDYFVRWGGEEFSYTLFGNAIRRSVCIVRENKKSNRKLQF